ncbi:response regulator transcription factor [Qipengyuania sp. RANM35]|uniref:response regulator transcription factor n=1 Tax=Qipengyuania sp. RANM35 TaxID=3068635 RepID=UPI0034DB59E3
MHPIWKQLRYLHEAICVTFPIMEKKQELHVVGGTSRSRAEQATLAFDLGYHCEVYSDETEFLLYNPRDGIVLAYDNPDRGGVARFLRVLAQRGIWLPVIGTYPSPRPRNVVDAVKAGALDYLSLPLRKERLGDAIVRINSEAGAFADARRRMIEARNRIAVLSTREREVLDWLAEGCSNKLIASEMSISPRTVEIHRAKMMSKLGADHVSQAVRLRMEANLEGSVSSKLSA